MSEKEPGNQNALTIVTLYLFVLGAFYFTEAFRAIYHVIQGVRSITLNHHKEERRSQEPMS